MNSFKRNWVTLLSGKATAVILISALVGCNDAEQGGQNVTQKSAQSFAKPKNVIYVLTDDQRYDELGFMSCLARAKAKNSRLLA